MVDTTVLEKSDTVSFSIFVAVICFITNISQMPVFVEGKITQMISMPVWVIAAFVCILGNKIRLNEKLIFPIICCAIIAVGASALSIFTKNDYVHPDIVYCFSLSLFIFLIGFWCGNSITGKGMEYICLSYIVSSIILAVNTYLTYFGSGFDIFSPVYTDAPKNSVSQIFFTALTFLFVVNFPRNKITRIIRWAGIAILIAIILILRSRATIIGIVLLLGIIILLRNIDYRIKLSALAVIVSFAVTLMNDKFYKMFINGILFAGRNATNLNDLSSGRVNQWKAFPQLIAGSEFTGIGRFKIESFPLSVLAQYGIILGFVFILFSLWPIYWALKHLDKSDAIKISFLIIACSYWVNGVFEQLAPFGPGVKCYMLWLMFGILLRKEGERDGADFTG